MSEDASSHYGCKGKPPAMHLEQVWQLLFWDFIPTTFSSNGELPSCCQRRLEAQTIPDSQNRHLGVQTADHHDTVTHHKKHHQTEASYTKRT
jgi:hypothetical protein